MTNEQQLRIEILELRLAMAALERVAARQQQMIDLLRERAVSESLENVRRLSAITKKLVALLDERTEELDNARN